jgi:hypothetical protein
MLNKLFSYFLNKPMLTSEQLDEKLDQAVAELQAFDAREMRCLYIDTCHSTATHVWYKSGKAPGVIFIAYENDRHIGKLRATGLKITDDQQAKIDLCRAIVSTKMEEARELAETDPHNACWSDWCPKCQPDPRLG